MRLIRPFEIFFLGGAILIGACVALWLSIWSPDALIRDPLPLYRQASVKVTADNKNKREILDVRLVDPDDNVVGFSVSLPLGSFDEDAGERLPTLVVISGFRGAHHNLERIPEPGPNVIISYDYPYRPEEWKTASLLERILIARRVAFRMPNDVAGLMAWVRRQHWADRSRISLVGVSLGAIALPVIRRRASATGQTAGPSVIAYGGVDLHAMAADNIDLSPGWLREIVAWGIAVALRPLEPAAHLSEITGPFLLINGRDDERLPRESVERLHALTPEPKTIINVKGAHIDGNRPEIIENTVRLARVWLVSKGALNPSR